MRFPQVSDRVKEAPAQALRGVFAGIGQLLLFSDKLRNKPPARLRKPEITAPQLAGATAGAAADPALADPAAADLPLPNYDELSVASLRARLRALDVTQLQQLTSYEQAHAGRPDVITMYERRIARLEAERRASQDGQAAAEAEIAARAEAEAGVRAELDAEGDG